MAEPLRVAVVGVGGIARRIYLPCLARRTDVALAWIADPSEAARAAVAAMYRAGHVFQSPPPSGTWPPVDCAFVLTPYTVRGEVIAPLLEAGIPVFCEKPLSLDLAEVERLAALAAETRCPLMVGFNRRFTPVLRWAWERSRGLRLDLCRVHKDGLALDRRALHAIDVLRWFCGDGEPVEIVARTRTDTEEAVTGVAALVRFNTGCLGIFHSAAAAGRWIEQVEAIGEGHTLAVDVPNVARLWMRGEETVYRPDATTWFLGGAERFGFAQQIEAFLAAVRAGQPPPIPAAQAVKSHRLAHAIIAACSNQ